jgi:chorismate synthase
MTALIEATAENKDSVGGILESVIIGVRAVVGEPWFDTVEGLVSHS